MPSSVKGYVIHAVRSVLVVGGIALVAGTLYVLLSISPGPPDGDGFVTGMAYLVWGVILVVSLGVTGLGFVLPAVLGADDPLGFNASQLWLLKVAGVLLVGGFLFNVGVTLAVGIELGLILWLGTVVLGVFGVFTALAWRLGEVISGRLGRVTDGGA